MSVLVAKVPHDQIESVWPLASTHLVRAITFSEGRYELEDVYWLLLSERMQLWLVADGASVIAACVTQIAEYPAKTMLDIAFLGGSGLARFAAPLLDKLRQYASEYRCSGIELNGRPGWLRAIKNLGFKPRKLVQLEVSL